MNLYIAFEVGNLIFVKSTETGQTTVKALISPLGAYLISGPKRGGLDREGGLISNHIFSTNFTIIFHTLLL